MKRLDEWLRIDKGLNRYRVYQTRRATQHIEGTLRWKAAPACPRQLYDAGGAQIGRLLYVIKGYQRLGEISDLIYVFDMDRLKWCETFEAPFELAHSHCAVSSDGERYIYFVSGQLGPQCCPAIPHAFSYDTIEKEWQSLPALPEARYAGTMQIFHGRLHFIGGSKPDRYTAAQEHWSLAVKDGKASGERWRPEVPVPLAGTHRGSAVVDDALYVFGGQQGDFTAVPADPNYACTHRTKETYFPDVYRLKSGAEGWERCADMLIPSSHIDFSVIVQNRKVYVIGGQVYKHPESFELRLNNAIQEYDLDSDRWSIAGHLPYRLKIPVCGYHKGTLISATGQRDKGGRDDSPGQITNDTWTASFPLRRAEEDQAPKDYLPHFKGKTVVLISHDLSQTGAPLQLIEVACAMRDSGATVRLATLANDAGEGNIADRNRIALIPVETSYEWAAKADLVGASTAVAGPWVKEYLIRFPEGAGHLAWWIHEIELESFLAKMTDTGRVAAVSFDSAAALKVWEGTGLPWPERRHVIHLANADEVYDQASAERLPWPARSRRLWGGSEPDMLTRSEIRHRLGIKDHEFLLCCVGTVRPGKGQMLLVKTVGGLLSQHPDLPLRLLLVGFPNDHQRREFLKNLTQHERRAINRRLAWTHLSEVAVFYRAADAFVMNTQGRGEPFGRVTTEAMAFGLPVLGTDAGGTREIVIDGQTGLLHPVGDEGLDTLAANILDLVHHRDKARALGEGGRKRAQEYFTARRFYCDLGAILAPILKE